MQFTLHLNKDKIPFLFDSQSKQYLYGGPSQEVALKIRDNLNKLGPNLQSIMTSKNGFYISTAANPKDTKIASWVAPVPFPKWTEIPSTVVPEITPVPSNPYIFPPQPNPEPITGWICPKCGGGVSPFTQKCPCSNTIQYY